MNGWGNLSLQFVKGPIGLIGAFYGSKTTRKLGGFFNYSYLKDKSVRVISVVRETDTN